MIKPTAPPSRRARIALQGLAAAWLAASILGACGHREHIAPIPLPASASDHVEVQGAVITASAYTDDEQAETAFGFDVRGAGILPVRISLDNQSATVLKINPRQTFLIDKQGQAWPVLTSEQAYNRIRREEELGEVGQRAESGAITGTIGAMTGLALGVLLSQGLATPVGNDALIGAGIGALYGGRQTSTELENQFRRELASKHLHNQRIPPGELAYGILFFPGRDEARSAQTLRLEIELDGYPQTVQLPLKLAPMNTSSPR